MTEVRAVIQARCKSNGIELAYEQSLSAAPRHSFLERDDGAARELERLHRQLRDVREWVDSGQWRESGSDGLYAILQPRPPKRR